MALIKCQECDADISDRAKACPKCGCPQNSFDPIITNSAKVVSEYAYVAKETVKDYSESGDGKGCLSVIGVVLCIVLIVGAVFITLSGVNFLFIGGVPIAIGSVVMVLVFIAKFLEGK